MFGWFIVYAFIVFSLFCFSENFCVMYAYSMLSSKLVSTSLSDLIWVAGVTLVSQIVRSGSQVWHHYYQIISTFLLDPSQNVKIFKSNINKRTERLSTLQTFVTLTRVCLFETYRCVLTQCQDEKTSAINLGETIVTSRQSELWVTESTFIDWCFLQWMQKLHGESSGWIILDAVVYEEKKPKVALSVLCWDWIGDFVWLY